MELETWAARHAQKLLAPLGNRWRHTQSVGRQARRVCGILSDEDRGVLVAAAFLHDLGYAPSLVQTGFHPVDGARYLRSLGHRRLAGLVAHHSAAHVEAELRGLADALAEFEDERSEVSMALAYCDMTTGPAGDPVTFTERLADVEHRYGPEHVVTRAIRQARPELERYLRAVDAKLRGDQRPGR